MATHSNILAWRIPWTEEPGGLQSMGSQRVGHDLATEQQQQSVDDQYKFYICEDVYKISLIVIYTFSCREPIFFCLDTFTVYVSEVLAYSLSLGNPALHHMPTVVTTYSQLLT